MSTNINGGVAESRSLMESWFHDAPCPLPDDTGPIVSAGEEWVAWVMQRKRLMVAVMAPLVAALFVMGQLSSETVTQPADTVAVEFATPAESPVAISIAMAPTASAHKPVTHKVKPASHGSTATRQRHR